MTETGLSGGMSLPEVTEIQRWKIEPGDRLIVHVEQPIDMQQVDLIREKVRHALALPDDVRVLVTGRGVGVEVASGPA